MIGNSIDRRKWVSDKEEFTFEPERSWNVIPVRIDTCNLRLCTKVRYSRNTGSPGDLATRVHRGCIAKLPAHNLDTSRKLSLPGTSRNVPGTQKP